MTKTDDIHERIDLRALRLLVAAVDLQSITRAGERTGMSQPAASRVIAMLRRRLADPILVRTTGGYSATPRAQEAALHARRAIAATAAALAATTFDPRTVRRRVRIATTDYGFTIVLTPLMRTLLEQAPGLSIAAVAWSESTAQDMEDGTVDLSLYADSDLSGDFLCRDLFSERYAVVLRSGHPALSHRDPIESVRHSPRIVVTYPEGRTTGRDDPLAELGAAGPVSLETPFFLGIDRLLALGDAVACLPRRAAVLATRSGTCVAVDMPQIAGFRYRLIWHRRLQHDPMFRWLRQAFAEAADR